jgi:hypothetical protein
MGLSGIRAVGWPLRQQRDSAGRVGAQYLAPVEDNLVPGLGRNLGHTGLGLLGLSDKDVFKNAPKQK